MFIGFTVTIYVRRVLSRDFVSHKTDTQTNSDFYTWDVACPCTEAYKASYFKDKHVL